MVIVISNDRKFVVRFQYGPAGRSNYSLKKAIRILERGSLNGVLSIDYVKSVLGNLKLGIKHPDSPEKFSRRKTICHIKEEFVIDGERVLRPICEVSSVNDSQESFSKDYGRTFAYKKAVYKAFKDQTNNFTEDMVSDFEMAWKQQMVNSAHTWDCIDVSYVLDILSGQEASKNN